MSSPVWMLSSGRSAIPARHVEGHARALVCKFARNIDPQLECAPTGGQVQASILTPCRAW